MSLDLLSIKYDFSIFEEIDKKNMIVIDKKWMETKLDEILLTSLNNFYQVDEKLSLNRVLMVDKRFKKVVPKKDDELIRQIVNVVAYNVTKFGTLKYGPVLCLNPSVSPSNWIDLSYYNQEGHKNDVASSFSVLSSELISNGDFRSNFMNFCEVRNVVFSDEHKKFQFPRSFLLLKGIDRAKCRRDMNHLFDYLMNIDLPSFVPEFLQIVFKVVIK
jgi:hypothetical protein